MDVCTEYELLWKCIQLQLASGLYGRNTQKIYRATILSTSSLASVHVSRFFRAQSKWHRAYATYTINLVSLDRDRREVGALHTMYRRRSASLSFWKRLRSWSTPALASLTSFSDTSSACSN